MHALWYNNVSPFALAAAAPPDAASGAPTARRDGTVLAGHGRTDLLQNAYANNLPIAKRSIAIS